MPEHSELSELRAELRTAHRRIQTLEAEGPRALLADRQVSQAIQYARVGLWAWDIEPNRVQWSEGVAELFGISPGVFEGTYEAYLALLPQEDRELVTQAIKQVLASGTDYRVEHRILARTEQPIWLEARAHLFRSDQGAPQRLVGVVVDITERRLAQQRLEESEHRFEVFTEASTEGIAISVDGQMADASNAMCRMFGYELEELVRMPIADLVVPEDEHLVRENIRTKNRQAYRHRARTKSGQILTVEARGGQFVHRGRPARLTALRNVTEDVRLAAEREKLEAQLRQAQKMEAVGQLAGGIAHDFNNILTVILANLELMEDKLENTSLAQEFYPLLKDVNHASTRARNLTAQLLTFGRRQSVCPQTIHLGEFLERMRSLLLPLIRENIALRIDGGSDPGTVEIDPGQLEQVVMNLVVNARDAMPSGGILTLEVETLSPKQNAAGGQVLLRVSDTGIGMNPTVLARAFDPFFTTKSRGQGSGLGLAMVDGIMEQAGGHVTAVSRPEKGCCFELVFPSVPDHGSMPAGASELAEMEYRAGGSETILLCEDDEAIRRMMLGLLSSAGYRVLTAECGSAALSVARDQGELDLLLTDVIMPGLDGKALSLEVLKIHPETKVLFCSGYAKDLISQQGLLGAGSFLLKKPFSRAELLRRVRLVLDSGFATGPNPT